MAMRLKEANVAFFEIVKTGTVFIRTCLEQCEIPHFQMQPFSYFLPDNETNPLPTNPRYQYDFIYHAPWWAYKYVDQKYCSIRHPLSWYESFWHFFHKLDHRIYNGYMDIGHFKKIPIDKDFNVFIDRCINEYPCLYTRMVEQFGGPELDIVKFIKLENIANELHNILFKLGYPGRMIDKIFTIEKQNVSKKNDFEWIEDQKNTILQLEQKIIKRFYHA